MEEINEKSVVLSGIQITIFGFLDCPSALCELRGAVLCLAFVFVHTYICSSWLAGPFYNAVKLI
jgi:hypothetical protein